MKLNKKKSTKELKPCLCRDCGQTKPSEFHKGRKSLCAKCERKEAKRKRDEKKKEMQHNEDEIVNTKTMTAEEQVDFNERCKTEMMDNLRLRREMLYG